MKKKIGIIVTLHSDNGADIKCQAREWDYSENEFDWTSGKNATQVDLYFHDKHGLQILTKGIPLRPEVVMWYAEQSERENKEFADFSDDNLLYIKSEYKTLSPAERKYFKAKRTNPGQGSPLRTAARSGCGTA